MGVTANQGLPYPENTDVPNVPLDIQELALAAETKLNMRFADAAARDAAVTAPVTGMNCYIDATKEYQLYSNTMWNTIWTGDFGAAVPRMSSLLSYQNRAGRPASTREGVLGLDRARNIVEGYNGAGWKHAGASGVSNTTFSSFGAGVLFANSGSFTYTTGPSFSLGNALSTTIAFTYTAEMAYYTTGSGQGQLVSLFLQYLPPGGNPTTGWVSLSQGRTADFRPVPISYLTYFHASASASVAFTAAGTYGLRLYFEVAGGGPQVNIYRVSMSASPIIVSTVFS